MFFNRFPEIFKLYIPDLGTLYNGYFFFLGVAALSAIGVILAAVYILFMFQKLFLGPVDKEENRKLFDLNVREILVLVPLIVLIFWIGLYPKPFFNLIAPAVDQVVAALQTAAVAGVPWVVSVT